MKELLITDIAANYPLESISNIRPQTLVGKAAVYLLSIYRHGLVFQSMLNPNGPCSYIRLSYSS